MTTDICWILGRTGLVSGVERECNELWGGWETHPLEVHRLHGLVHPTHDRGHIPGNLPMNHASAQRHYKHVSGGKAHRSHRHRCLNPAGHGVNPRRKPEQVEGLVLLPDRIRGVYPCTVRVALLERLLDPQEPVGHDEND